MRVGLIDADNLHRGKITFPNLPLMKLSAWHKVQGDSVEWWYPPSQYDIVYESKVFPATPEPPEYILADKIIKGGTGYDLKNILQSEIEHGMPDYTLYPEFKQAYGFLTRGCPRNCPFCIVTRKEGCETVKVADLTEFWQKGIHKEIKLLDPNLLSCREHEELLQQLVDSRAWVDFTQGLDIRLVTPRNIELIKQIKIKQIHFAWDNPRENLLDMFREFKELSGIADRRKTAVYVLTNFNSSTEEDLRRIYALREADYWPYVMIYDKANAPLVTRRMQRWVNNRFIFERCKTFEEYQKEVRENE